MKNNMIKCLLYDQQVKNYSIKQRCEKFVLVYALQYSWQTNLHKETTNKCIILKMVTVPLNEQNANLALIILCNIYCTYIHIQ